jgi:hypothetical protein
MIPLYHTGKSVKQTPRPANATLRRSLNRRGISTETTSGTNPKDNHVELDDDVNSDDEANELDEDHANSDEDHAEPDDDHTKPDNDNSDGNSKDVGSRWSGGTPRKTRRNGEDFNHRYFPLAHVSHLSQSYSDKDKAVSLHCPHSSRPSDQR